MGYRAFFLFASPSLFSKICLLLPDFGTPISPRIRRFSADFMPKLTSACQILKASTLRFTVKACKRAKIQYVKCPTQNALGRRRVKWGFIVLCALLLYRYRACCGFAQLIIRIILTRVQHKLLLCKSNYQRKAWILLCCDDVEHFLLLWLI